MIVIEWLRRLWQEIKLDNAEWVKSLQTLLTIILDDSYIDSHVDHHIDCGFSPYMLMINFVLVSFPYHKADVPKK